MTLIPCISLHQPWASAIFAGLKHHETRHWAYKPHLEGQTIAIHAAQRIQIPGGGVAIDALETAFGPGWYRELPRGAVLGTVKLSGCFETENHEPVSEADRALGDWGDGRFAWRLTEIRPLTVPLPMKGRQGWWKIPAEIPFPA